MYPVMPRILLYGRFDSFHIYLSTQSQMYGLVDVNVHFLKLISALVQLWLLYLVIVFAYWLGCMVWLLCPFDKLPSFMCVYTEQIVVSQSAAGSRDMLVCFLFLSKPPELPLVVSLEKLEGFWVSTHSRLTFPFLLFKIDSPRLLI